MTIPKEGVLGEAKYVTSKLRGIQKQLEASASHIGNVSSMLSQDDELIKETLDEHSYTLKNALYATKKRLASVQVWATHILQFIKD